MKKLLILSGKGGTGKTTTAAAFIEFANAKAFADCDVDAPNLHLIKKISAPVQHTDYYGSKKSVISPEKCVGCGICKEFCRFDAIEKSGDVYKVNEYACEGCGVCLLKCPAQAVTMVDDIAGDLMLYRGEQVFSDAKLKMGRGTSGKLVADVKSNLYNSAPKDADVAIIDGSPGIGCPVIASISGVDMVLVVVEPSLSGMSDMERILKTSEIFGTKAVICINKFDTCIEQSDAVKEYCDKNSIAMLGCIPYDSNVSKAINEGKNIAQVECPARSALKQVFERVMEELME